MNEEMEIDLKELFNIILKRKIMIVLVTFTFMVGAALMSIYYIQPKYQGKVSIVIGKEGANDFYENSYTNSDIMMYQKLVKTYVEISTSRRVISRVAEEYPEYSYEAIQAMVKGAAKSDTQLFTITVTGGNPKDVADIANNVAKYFIIEANYYLSAGKLNVLDSARIPDHPISPNVRTNIVIAGMLGLMLAIGICFLIEFLDTKVKSEEDLKSMVDVPVLAVIPFVQEK